MISIILPTYNRARFLSSAFNSIREQTFQDWELIIVDDGSQDNTGELVPQLTKGWAQPVHYIRQENQGAYAARNTGLSRAERPYIAFFDSDDLWLPHHLQDCFEGLESNPDVDWVWSASRRVDDATGEVIQESSFRKANGKPHKFLQLHTTLRNKLHVLDDPRVLSFAILHNFYSGPQTSLIRREVFESWQYYADLPNGGDRMALIRALAEGRTLGYFDDVHLIYRIHGDNSSSPASQGAFEKRLRVARSVVRGYERLCHDAPLGPAGQQALRQRLSREYFWSIGYNILWLAGRQDEALAMFHKGLYLSPTNLQNWKTYLIARLRRLSGIGLPPKESEPPISEATS